MLKGIPDIMSPELLKLLMEMGHGDELVIADGNYPKGGHPNVVVRCDGHGVSELLDAILQFFPLDTFVENPAILMEVSDKNAKEPEIWDVYKKIGAKRSGGLRELPVERFTFYDRARKAYAVITTSEKALCANIIIKKGVVINTPEE